MTSWRPEWREHRFIIIGGVIFGLIAGASLLAPLLSLQQMASRARPFAPPSWLHPLGADDVGRDVLSQILYGGRTSLLVGVAVGAMTATVGLVIGGLAGYSRWLETPLMRAVDMLLVIPRLPLIIFLSLFLKPSLGNVILILSLFGWPVTARAVRPIVKSLRHTEFVIAAQGMGAGHGYVFRCHILPQVYSIFAVQFILEVRHAIMAEAGLGFLGLEDPTTRSWGMMLSYAFNHEATFLSDAWQWTVLPPAVVLTLFILSLSLIGIGLESAFNPRLRREADARSVEEIPFPRAVIPASTRDVTL
jgi:ABC-type dipeptide/oligopeptide/nickel transport system permease subunit